MTPRGTRARASCIATAAAVAILLCAPGRAQSSADGADGVLANTPVSAAAADPIYVPDLSRVLPAANDRTALSSSLQIVVLLTILAIAPSILLMMTAFTRILVVLILLRQALGTQQLPPSQVLTGLAMFMTFLVMAPTGQRINERALQPYLDGRLDQLTAIDLANQELRGFMFAQIRAAGNEQDVYLMHEYAVQRAIPESETIDEHDVSTAALIPAFILSEMKTAFLIGFRIYLPFLVIDLVIATVLVAMGMMMLPPVLISLPFKLLLFVLADGWHLVAGALMASVHA